MMAFYDCLCNILCSLPQNQLNLAIGDTVRNLGILRKYALCFDTIKLHGWRVSYNWTWSLTTMGKFCHNLCNTHQNVVSKRLGCPLTSTLWEFVNNSSSISFFKNLFLIICGPHQFPMMWWKKCNNQELNEITHKTSTYSDQDNEVWLIH